MVSQVSAAFKRKAQGCNGHPSCRDAELDSAYGLFPANSLYFWCLGTQAVLTINMVTSRFFFATWAWEKMLSSTGVMSGLHCSRRLMTHLS